MIAVVYFIESSENDFMCSHSHSISKTVFWLYNSLLWHKNHKQTQKRASRQKLTEYTPVSHQESSKVPPHSHWWFLTKMWNARLRGPARKKIGNIILPLGRTYPQWWFHYDFFFIILWLNENSMNHCIIKYPWNSGNEHSGLSYTGETCLHFIWLIEERWLWRNFFLLDFLNK